jgi:HSF-type DNA-binding
MGRNSNTDEPATDASAFLKKTYAILMDKKNKEVISWSACGTKFSILDHERFADEILPQHFKHNNAKSFVRQLNIHGFKKIGPKTEKGRDYFNEHFKRGKPEMLAMIQRVSVKHRDEKSETENTELEQLRFENESLKKKITSLELTGSTFSVEVAQKPEEAHDAALLMQLYQRMKNTGSSASSDSRENEVMAKLQELLISLKSLSTVHSNSDSENWKDDSSLGKRSTHSVEDASIYNDLNYNDDDTLTWFNTEFREQEAFASREFTFDLDN